MLKWVDRRGVLGVVGCVLGAAAVVIAVAGPLNPPSGAVSSTYKTLSEVEPRIAINSTNTPGDADSVFKITQPGSYYLTGNLAGASGKSGIEVAASDVTIDLSGFTMSGTAGSLAGIRAVTTITGLTVRRGDIINWTGSGVEIPGSSSGVLVEDVRITGCSYGVWAVFSTTVRRCHISACTLEAIYAADWAVVEDCVLTSNARSAVKISNTGRVERCLVSGNGSGVDAGANSTIRGVSAVNNLLSGGGGFGIRVGQACVVEDSTAIGNPGTGFLTTGNSVSFTRCDASFNGFAGFTAAANAAFLDCHSAQNSGDGFSAGDAATVRGCTAADNSGRGIFGNNGCHIENNLTRNNQQDGIVVNFSGAVIGNNCNGDGAAAGVHGAIKVVGQANRVEGNNVSYADRGLYLTSGGNSVFRNSVKGCTVNFDIVGGNDVGPIGSAAAATSPWANIQY